MRSYHVTLRKVTASEMGGYADLKNLMAFGYTGELDILNNRCG